VRDIPNRRITPAQSVPDYEDDAAQDPSIIHTRDAVCEGEGRPIMMMLTEGQMSDYKGAFLLFDALPLWATRAMTATGSAPR
jgi:hypothetical protein